VCTNLFALRLDVAGSPIGSVFYACPCFLEFEVDPDQCAVGLQGVIASSDQLERALPPPSFNSGDGGAAVVAGLPPEGALSQVLPLPQAAHFAAKFPGRLALSFVEGFHSPPIDECQRTSPPTPQTNRRRTSLSLSRERPVDIIEALNLFHLVASDSRRASTNVARPRHQANQGISSRVRDRARPGCRQQGESGALEGSSRTGRAIRPELSHGEGSRSLLQHLGKGETRARERKSKEWPSRAREPTNGQRSCGSRGETATPSAWSLSVACTASTSSRTTRPVPTA
jgi:hypothetical protein